MTTFNVIIEASVSTVGGNAPLLEMLVDGVVVGSFSVTALTGSGTNIFEDNFDFVGNFPSSVSYRFAGSSGDPGDVVTLDSVRINGHSIPGGGLTSTILNQGQSAIQNMASTDYLFGRVSPSAADLGGATESGTGGADDIVGNDDGIGDVIDAGGGDDIVALRDDDDAVLGGDGNDQLYGQNGNDILVGGNGDDRLFGNEGNDILYGDANNDTLRGGAGDDTLSGGTGNDFLVGDAGDDILLGGDGADRLVGVSGANIMYGDAGADMIFGGRDNDIAYGGADNDTVHGGNGDDTLFGGTGNDFLTGGNGNDEISGGEDNDNISGGAGNDTIYGDNSGSTTVMEAGRLTVTQTSSTQWHSVSFTDALDTPSVKMFAQDVNGDPFTLRVRNVTNTGFEFQLDEFDYQNGVTAAETVTWMAVSQGSHVLSNGMIVEAGSVTATNENTTAASFTNSYTNPIVFSQISSDNDAAAVVTRNFNVTGTGFSVQMQEEEAADGNHATEDIGWIVIEAGGSAGLGFLASTTGDNVTQNTTTINFGAGFAAAPVFLADMQTLDGGDTAYAAGASAVTSTQAQVFIDEEASSDTETSHTNENVGYVALNSGVYEVFSNVSGADIIRGDDGNDILYADAVEDTSAGTRGSGNLLKKAILADNPDAYWSLSETLGTIADNEGLVGAAIDGTINGSPILGASALYAGGGTAIDFDGVNDGIFIPDNNAINTAATAERTMELVFNADNVTTRQVLWEEGGTTNGLTIYIDGGRVYVTGEDDGDWADANISAAISTGTTYHVAFVFDQPNNSFEGFLDGVSMGSVTVNNAVFPAHSADIGIGYAPDGLQFHDGEDGSGGYYFNGRISDVALYNTALTASQIQARADIVKENYAAAPAIDDVLYGGDGFDQLYGGTGRDSFVFEAASAYNDIDQINGFNMDERDSLDISDILVGYTVSSDINDFIQFSNSGNNTIVSVDANGAVGGVNFAGQEIAQINNLTDLSADLLLATGQIIT